MSALEGFWEDLCGFGMWAYGKGLGFLDFHYNGFSVPQRQLDISEIVARGIKLVRSQSTASRNVAILNPKP